MRAIVLGALALGACTATIPEGQLVCVDEGDCPDDWSCLGGRCYSPEHDAGPIADAGSDGGARDAGSMDAGSMDAGSMDAGSADGGGDAGPLDAGPPPTPVQVAAGIEHSCAVYSDGSAYCWGDNSAGQLGSGSPGGTAVNMARRVEGLSPAVQIALGTKFTCARHATGVSCWGDNSSGQLGNSVDTTLEPRPVAVDLPGGDPPIDLSASSEFACAVLASGAVYCWGSDASGRLGRTPTGVARTPVPIPGIASALQVSNGHGHACARLDEGSILCWGLNLNGQLGRGSTSLTAEPVPMPVSDFGKARLALSVDSGVAHTCASTDTATYCWGYNGQGQLGDTTTDQSPSPRMVATPPASPVAALSAGGLAFGGSHTCAIAPDARLYCWGSSNDGRLGIGDPGFGTPAYPTPTLTMAAMPVADVSAGGEHTCAIADEDQVFCWGRNQRGQLGNTLPDTMSNTPTSVAGLP